MAVLEVPKAELDTVAPPPPNKLPAAGVEEAVDVGLHMGCPKKEAWVVAVVAAWPNTEPPAAAPPPNKEPAAVVAPDMAKLKGFGVVAVAAVDAAVVVAEMEGRAKEKPDPVLAAVPLAAELTAGAPPKSEAVVVAAPPNSEVAELLTAGAPPKREVVVVAAPPNTEEAATLAAELTAAAAAAAAPPKRDVVELAGVAPPNSEAVVVVAAAAEAVTAAGVEVEVVAAAVPKREVCPNTGAPPKAGAAGVLDEIVVVVVAAAAVAGAGAAGAEVAVVRAGGLVTGELVA